jgi:hypothetical protein
VEFVDVVHTFAFNGAMIFLHSAAQPVGNSYSSCKIVINVENRRTLVAKKVRLNNSITAALKSYYPKIEIL